MKLAGAGGVGLKRVGVGTMTKLGKTAFDAEIKHRQEEVVLT